MQALSKLSQQIQVCHVMVQAAIRCGMMLTVIIRLVCVCPETLCMSRNLVELTTQIYAPSGVAPN